LKDIEDVLNSQKVELQKLQAPEELEDRLRTALNKTTLQKIRINKGFIAAAIAFVLLFSYNFDTLAYYSKKMMGYETIAQGSISELNEEGAGQEIQRSHTFSNGVEVLLEGIMFDENELVAFYKIQSTGLNIDEISLLMEINGLNPIRYSARGGSGVHIDNQTQFWVHSFEAPKFYEKWLSLDITMLAHNNSSEQGSIKFTLDRSKAMKRIVKQDIGKQVEIENLEINFLTLTASRLNTTIGGLIEPLQTNSQGVRVWESKEQPTLKFDIFVDDAFYDTAYVGVNFSNKKEFKTEVRGLPLEFNGIDFRNFRLVQMKMADNSVDISFDTRNLVVDEDLIITRVYQEGDNTCIVIKSKGIPIMGLFRNDKQVKAVDESDYSELPVSPKAVERVYRFEGQSPDMTLMFKVINYTQYADDTTKVKVL